MPAECLYHAELLLSHQLEIFSEHPSSQPKVMKTFWSEFPVKWCYIEHKLPSFPLSLFVVLIWALTAVFIWGRKRRLYNGGLEQGIVWFDAICLQMVPYSFLLTNETTIKNGSPKIKVIIYLLILKIVILCYLGPLVSMNLHCVRFGTTSGWVNDDEFSF